MLNEKYESVIEEMKKRYEKVIEIRNRKLSNVRIDVTPEQWELAFKIFEQYEKELEMKRSQCIGAEIAFRKLESSNKDVVKCGSCDKEFTFNPETQNYRECPHCGNV